MFEIVIFLTLCLIYIIPFEGIISLSEVEKSFMCSYKSFSTLVSIEDSSSEDLLGSDNTVRDIPTLMDFSSQEDSINNEYEDIDISHMGR